MFILNPLFIRTYFVLFYKNEGTYDNTEKILVLVSVSTI